MTPTAEQMIAANKANVEALFGLTTKAFESIEKLVELNLTASRAALADAADHTTALMGVKDAQEMIALQANALQPIAEKTAAYSRHLLDIANTAGAEIGKAVETKAAEAKSAVTSFVDTASRNAPAGSETTMALMKNAIAAASGLAESMQKAAKQATDTMEANYSSLSATAMGAAKTATATATRKRA